MSNIEIVIEPKAKDLGDDFVVRRVLPAKNKNIVGPFIFWDHMGPVVLEGKKEMKVRAHPHIGLATITWLFSGEIMHRDSLGNEQAIRPGEVNWMTAGAGIVHSERSYPKTPAETLEGIQLWLALPKEHEDIDPSFYHCKQEDVPFIEQEGLHLRLIAGEGLGKKSPVPVYSDLFYFNGQGEAQQIFDLPLKINQEGACYIVDGEIEVEGTTYGKYNLVVFKKASAVKFKMTCKTSFMVFGGEIFTEKRHLWWNFVSTSQAKIEMAKEKWRNKDFPEVINEKEYIPLPEN